MLMRATARPAVSRAVAAPTPAASGASGSHARAGVTIETAPATNKAAPANLMKRVMHRLCAGDRTLSSHVQILPGNGTRDRFGPGVAHCPHELRLSGIPLYVRRQQSGSTHMLGACILGRWLATLRTFVYF